MACLVDMVDGIVDIVQTGTTLKSNGLVEKEKIKTSMLNSLQIRHHILKIN